MLWRRKLLMMLVMAGMLKASLLVISSLPSLYESRTLILVSGQQFDDSQSSSAQVTAVTQQALSRAGLAALVQRHQLKRPGEETDEAIERLRKEIRLETKLRDYYPQVPDSISIAYRHSNPQIAQQVLNDLVAQFEAANEALKRQIINEADRVSAELADLEGPLRELSEARAAAAIGAAGPSRESAEPRALRISTGAAIETLSDKEYALQQQISQQQHLIAEQQKILKSAPPARDSAYGVLLVRKAEIEALLKEYSAQYTERNPKVTQARAQLAEVNRQLAQFDAGGAPHTGLMASPEANELRALQRDLARLETDLGITRRELERKKQLLASLPGIDELDANVTAEIDRQAAESAAEYEHLSKRFYWLLDKQHLLQKTSSVVDGESSPALFKVIDRPYLPQSPAAPNYLTLKLAALGLALGTALLLAAVAEAPRLFLIRDHRDIEYFLGAPVLGLIPESLTSAERRQRRRQQLVRSLALALVVMALVPVVARLLGRLQVFHMVANRW
jgi:uncharacterized protein involved in exopolysaccharide biosynthesis